MKRRNLTKVGIGSMALMLVVTLFAGTGWTPAAVASPGSKPTTHIKIAAARVGDPWYVLSEALAYFINHNSNWLRATVVATPGQNDNAKLESEKPQEYLAISGPNNITRVSKDPRFNYYDKDRFIANAASMTVAWVSYDKKIKTVHDLDGKKVMLGRKGRYSTADLEAILEGHEMLDKIKPQHGGFGGGKINLKDGLVDVAVVPVDHIYPDRFSKGAFVTDLETKGPIYYVSLEEPVMKKLWKEEKYGGVPVRVSPGALDQKSQPSELWIFGWPTFFGADERMNPDIVYEVTRIIWESAGKWEKWHPQGAHMTKEFIPAIPVDFKYVHPGAKKFYDEHGIKLRQLSDLLTGRR